MEQDPLIVDQGTDVQAAANAVVDFLSLDTEIRRYRLIQGLCFTDSDQVSMLIFPPGGKVGGVITLMNQAAVPLVVRARLWPENGLDSQSRYGGRYIDVLAGWTLRIIFSSSTGLFPEAGSGLVMYERITQERIKLQYGKKAMLNTSTGVVTYPQVDDAENLSLVVQV